MKSVQQFSMENNDMEIPEIPIDCIGIILQFFISSRDELFDCLGLSVKTRNYLIKELGEVILNTFCYRIDNPLMEKMKAVPSYMTNIQLVIKDIKNFDEIEKKLKMMPDLKHVINISIIESRNVFDFFLITQNILYSKIRYENLQELKISFVLDSDHLFGYLILCFQKLINLIKLDISLQAFGSDYIKDVKTDFFYDIFNECPNFISLRCLKFTFQRPLNEFIIEDHKSDIFRNIRFIRYLALYDIGGLKNEDFEVFSENLKKIKLSHIPGINEEIFQNYKELWNFNISNCEDFSKNFLKMISNKKNIKVLSFGNKYLIEDLSTLYPGLEQIEIKNSNEKYASLHSKMKINENYIKNDYFNGLVKLNLLIIKSNIYTYGLDKSYLFLRSNALNKLQIYKHNLVQILDVRGVENLTVLKISRCGNFKNFKNFKSLKNIKELSIQYCTKLNGKESMIEVSNSTTLHTLQIIYSKFGSSASFDSIRLKNLGVFCFQFRSRNITTSKKMLDFLTNFMKRYKEIERFLINDWSFFKLIKNGDEVYCLKYFKIDIPKVDFDILLEDFLKIFPKVIQLEKKKNRKLIRRLDNLF